MDTRNPIDNSAAPKANHVAFNNNREYFSVALDSGFAIYKSETCEQYMDQEQQDKIRMALMLESSQIVGLLKGVLNPKRESDRLSLWDSNKRQEVASVKTRDPILRVCLTKSHLVIVFEKNAALYKHQPKLEKIAIYETAKNMLGICCLGKHILVLPGRSPGQIQLLSLADRKVSIIPAHASPLRALELSPDERVIASASDRGTLIRLHSTETCARVGELRRGITPATIYSLAISPSSTRLAVTSDTNTLHIFDLPFQAGRFDNDSHASTEGGWQHVDSPPGSGGADQGRSLKWGGLARLPFTPRIFTDVYSLASVAFDPGNDEYTDVNARTRHKSDFSDAPIEAPPKGLAGWVNNETVAVISAGKDARYERFALSQDSAGKVICVRVGRSRYLIPN